jgi:hypothetical protein
MIANNDENEIVPQLQPEDMFKCFYLLVGKHGGHIEIKQEAIDKVKDDFNLEISHEIKRGKKNNELSWHFKIPELMELKKMVKGKRKRGIIKPNRRLILPE